MQAQLSLPWRQQGTKLEKTGSALLYRHQAEAKALFQFLEIGQLIGGKLREPKILTIKSQQGFLNPGFHILNGLEV
ncbi:MAG: hypothetical protein ACQEQ0_14290 [Bacteroidota bacterium]